MADEEGKSGVVTADGTAKPSLIEAENPAEVLAAIHVKGRDNARTPMQWERQPQRRPSRAARRDQAQPNHGSVNARTGPWPTPTRSSTYRRLIELRRSNPVLVYGHYQMILPDHPQIYAWLRTLEADRLLVICNFGCEPVRFECPGNVRFDRSELLIANYAVDARQDLRAFSLRPFEARICRLL